MTKELRLIGIHGWSIWSMARQNIHRHTSIIVHEYNPEDNLNDRYGFHDTKLIPIIKHAPHVVSIAEKQDNFTPSLWDIKIRYCEIKQVLFAIMHFFVGGWIQR